MKRSFYEIVNICWKLACKYDFHKLSDDEWEQLTADGDKALRMYDVDSNPMPIRKLAHKMLIDVIYFYEDIAKEEKSNGKGKDWEVKQ